MEEKYFENALNLYREKGIRKNLFIYDSAYKYTDICMWEYGNMINISNGFDFIYAAEDVKDYNNNYYNDKKQPIMIYETSNYLIMSNILSIVNNCEYEEALEHLKNLTEEKNLVLKKN